LPRETSTADNDGETGNDEDKVIELNWAECGVFIKTKINAQTADKIWEKLQDENGQIPASKLVELMIFVGTLHVSYDYKRKNLGKPQIHKAKFKKFIAPFQQWLLQTHLTESNSLSKKQFIEELSDWVIEVCTYPFSSLSLFSFPPPFGFETHCTFLFLLCFFSVRKNA
ncbi:hypothetical protein RFI_22822, partial [Reticulomyxa filosa]